MKSKVLLRFLSVLVLVLVIAISSVATFFITLDPNAFVDDFSNIGKVPQDEGTLTSHIFEAETAEHTGVSTNQEHACIAHSYYYSHTFSGGIALRNIQANTLTFKFTSDQTYMVPMVMRLAAHNSWEPVALNSVYVIKMNDKTVSTAGIDVPGSTASEQIEGTKYFNMVNVEVPIKIKKGDNVLTLETSGYGLNIDYVDIKTSANIVDKTQKAYWENMSESVSITTQPTLTTKGTITIDCPVQDCLNTTVISTVPVLTDASYQKETAGGKVKFYQTVAGQKLLVGEQDESVMNTEYKLTVVGGKLSGNKTEDNFKLATFVNITPDVASSEIRQLKGWYNFDTREIVSTNPDGITMPANNLKVAPFYEGKSIGTLVEGKESGVGKVNLGVTNTGVTTVQANSTVKPVYSTGVVAGESGTIYTSTTVIDAGKWFIPMTGYTITAKAHTFDFTFENMGTNALKFYVYMVNSSSNGATVPSNKVEVNLAAGDIKTVQYSVDGFENGNILPVIYFPDGASELNLGAFAYCTFVKPHECESKCTKCNKCLDATCTEDACKTKCDCAHECESKCPTCNKCLNLNCTEKECANKCTCAPTSATKTVNTVSGLNFFDATLWQDFSNNPRTAGQLYDAQGNLRFTASTASRFDLFHTTLKSVNDGYTHLFDKGGETGNIKTDSAKAMFGKEYTYDLTVSSTGAFDLLIGGAKGSTADRDKLTAGGIWLNFATDGKMTVYHGNSQTTTTYTSWGLLSGATSFNFSGANKITLKITRINDSDLLVKVYVNDAQVMLSGTDTAHVKVQSGAILSTGVLNKTGYGQRVGFIPLENTIVTVSGLVITYPSMD